MDIVYKHHESVLLEPIIETLFEQNSLKDQDPFYFVDLTFGRGGHSFELAKRFPNVHLVGVDQDIEAINNGKLKAKSLGVDRIEFHHMNFSEFVQNASSKENKQLNNQYHAILADLGVSSHQLDSDYRGFSFTHDGPLDMRMNQTGQTPTAKDVLNDYSEKEIADIIFEFGEERLSRKIARMIVEQRKEKPIDRTSELENICFHAYPKTKRFGGIHPATRTFQALRIYVNNELGVLGDLLDQVSKLIRPGGRLGIISFHSLEDRIVKHRYKALKSEGKCDIITKKPLVANEEELQHNKRSRSAKYRVMQKK
jgi:16S rRNA (cytosine1402-N4)-methyltransferase